MEPTSLNPSPDHQTHDTKALFDEAFELLSEPERQAYLDRVCAGDPNLRRKVEALLSAAGHAGSFLEQPAIVREGSLPYPNNSAPLQTQSLTLDYGKSGQSTDHDDLSGSTVGNFELIAPIGRGGMGAVYLATQLQPIRRVAAIKIIKAPRDDPHFPAFIERFNRERQALSGLQHPHIARLLEAGNTSNGDPYFAMDYVRGQTLVKYCDQKRLPIRQRLQLFVLLCQAVQYAHAKGVIHRDLKPGNILVTEVDGQPAPCVIDFGLALEFEPGAGDTTGLARERSIVGTPLYMSPEQTRLDQRAIDTRTDVYSLGAILYELLTGTTPLREAEVRNLEHVEIWRKICELPTCLPSVRIGQLEGGDIARQISPSQHARTLRGELDAIAIKALQKQPDDRYDTASALGRDVQRFLDNDLVEAVPVTATYRIKKFASKNRGVLATLGGFIGLLLLGVVGLSIGLAMVDMMRRRAETSEKSAMSLLDVNDATVRVLLQNQTNLQPKEKERLKAVAEEMKATLTDMAQQPETHRTAVIGYSRLAFLWMVLREPQEWEASLRKAVELGSSLPVDDSKNAKLLGRIHHDLGTILQKKNDPEAIEIYRKAIAVFEPIAAEDVNTARDLADVHNNLGVIFRESNKPAEAERELRRAVALGESILTKEDTIAFRISMGAASHNLGNIIRDRDPHASLEWYGKSIDLLKNLENPTEALRNAHWDRAAALGQLKQHEAACDDWGRAIQLDRGKDRKHLEMFLGLERAEWKLAEAKNPEAGRLHALAVANARAVSNANCVGEADLAKRYAARSLELLRQARAAGYYRAEEPKRQLQAEPAFTSLPGDEFRRFLSELEAKPKAPDTKSEKK